MNDHNMSLSTDSAFTMCIVVPRPVLTLSLFFALSLTYLHVPPSQIQYYEMSHSMAIVRAVEIKARIVAAAAAAATCRVFTTNQPLETIQWRPRFQSDRRTTHDLIRRYMRQVALAPLQCNGGVGGGGGVIPFRGADSILKGHRAARCKHAPLTKLPAL